MSAIPAKINGKANPEYFRAYYAENRDRILERNRKWRQEHKYRGIGNVQYRAMVIALLRERDGDSCGICGLPVSDETASIDHIVQRAIGGSNAAHNLRLTHLKCNTTRPRRQRKRRTNG